MTEEEALDCELYSISDQLVLNKKLAQKVNSSASAEVIKYCKYKKTVAVCYVTQV